MLPGFQYPVYTCVCPQTKYTFDVRCLTVSEEDKILSSATFGYQMLHNINEILYQCCVNKPDNIKTFDDFRKHVTQKDRDALLYSLLQASDADEQVLEVVCASCRAKKTVKVKLSECFSANMYPGAEGEILQKEVPVTVQLGDYTGVFTLKVPTLERERQVLTYLGPKKVSISMLTFLLTVHNAVLKQKDQDVEKAESLSDLEVMLRSVPGKVGRKIRNVFNEEFGQYGMNLQYRYICDDCGSTNTHTIDLVEVLFRTVTE